MLHSVDPNVDQERDKLAAQVMTHLPETTVQLTPLKSPVTLDEEHDYFTDGRVLVISNVTKLNI